MTTANLDSAKLLRRALRAGVLGAFTALTACSTRLTPAVVQVGGHAVEVVEAGSGQATVVFESGLGNDWTPWDQVASEVALRARVVAYSRAGYGPSEPSTEPRDPAHVVEDLRALLAARRYAPPYVLVGHSFGGTYMELFAKAHPDEVAALVLVEPRHRDFSVACEREGIQGCSIPPAVVRRLPPVQIAEVQGFARAADEIGAAGPFGRYPVRVLAATSHGFPSAGEALWMTMLGSLAKEAPDGRRIVFSGAGHNLETERAHEVAEAIASVLPARGN